MGGGKIIDCGKVFADHLNIPLVVVPTVASTDAPCTGCAVIYDKHNHITSFEIQKNSPAIVLVDTNILLASPIRYFISGMADALATGFEAKSWLKKVL
ncbi:hypothetical protein AZF37_03490 [endosymbiont 'TC1' of Trimyema compressum]|nr:hypothetical protein AZF37_03490 [endosymbiont 'TC1' of Trimyema compressum]